MILIAPARGVCTCWRCGRTLFVHSGKTERAMPHHRRQPSAVLMKLDRTKRVGVAASALLVVCAAHAQATGRITHERRMDQMYFSPDGGSLMTHGSSGTSGSSWEDGKVYLWATQGPGPRWQELPYTNCHAFSGDGQKLFLYGGEGALRGVPTGQKTDLHLGQ